MIVALGAESICFQHLVHDECPFRRLTGWDCPACGGTRALGNVLSGHPLGAVRDNAAAVLAGAILLLGLMPGVRNNKVGRRINTLIVDCPALGWIGLLVAWTLLRNCPGLTWMSPDR